MADRKTDRQKAAEIVRDAGGRIVGRTKLQKVAYLLELAGLGEGFAFEYRHYGPYSESLADAVKMANAFGLIEEVERETEWGGVYSIYTVARDFGQATNKLRCQFAEAAAQIGAVELELAATAAYLRSVEGYKDPWAETARRKPEKSDIARITEAKNAFRALQKIPVPRSLPNIA